VFWYGVVLVFHVKETNMPIPYYTRGDKSLTEASDMSALVNEFEKERDNLDTAFTGVQAAIGTTVGSQGNQGRQGWQGVVGFQGVVGSQGNVGPQGLVGAQGVVGSQGVLGSQGVIGPQGDQAYSAGTPADWATSAPVTIKSALDRISAALAAHLGTPIP
jgi:hypothetical protein